jgi:hypothetical protein
MKKYRFVVPGKAVGHVATTTNSKWSKEYQRFADYAKKVREYAAAAGISLPLYADEENQIVVKTISYFPNRVHCDAPNVNKGVTDALFYDEMAKALAKALGKRGTGKGDDKHAGAIAPPPRYDKENPRVVVIVKPYRKKSDDLCDPKRNEKGRSDKDRDNVSGKKRKKKRRASNGKS